MHNIRQIAVVLAHLHKVGQADPACRHFFCRPCEAGRQAGSGWPSQAQLARQPHTRTSGSSDCSCGGSNGRHAGGIAAASAATTAAGSCRSTVEDELAKLMGQGRQKELCEDLGSQPQRHTTIQQTLKAWSWWLVTALLAATMAYEW